MSSFKSFFLPATAALCLLLTTQQASAASLKELRKRCDSGGSSVACAQAGVYLEKQGKKQAALPYYRKACKDLLRPIGMACYLWGFLLTSPQKAFPVFLRACKYNDADGCTSAGEIFAKRKQVAKAMPYYRKGCKLEDGRGCHRVARYLFRQKKPKQAFPFLLRSCKFKYPPGCGFAGWFWEVKKKDVAKAKSFYMRGCKLKSSVECARLGLLLVRQQKYDEGLRYLRRACRWGFRKACRRARILNSQLKSKPSSR